MSRPSMSSRPASLTTPRRGTCAISVSSWLGGQVAVDTDQFSPAGSSSNHAVFWSLTASIANMGHRSSHLYKEPLWPGRDNRGPAQLPIPPSSSVKAHLDKDADKPLMPDRGTAVRWISRFFDTVGATLPYMTEPGLLAGLDKVLRNSRDEPSTRPLRPLLSIVFAHALSTLDEGSPEPFYRRTLRLLDPKTLYVSSLELRTNSSLCPSPRWSCTYCVSQSRRSCF